AVGAECPTGNLQPSPVQRRQTRLRNGTGDKMKVISKCATTRRTLNALVVALLLCLAGALASAQTYTVIHSFTGTDGAGPHGAMIQRLDGNFYGAANSGGSSGFGTIFRVTPGGTLSVLHNFHGNDGANPTTSLALATDGSIYGTTSAGGTSH